MPPAAESTELGVTDQMLDGGTQTSGQEPSGRGCCNGQAERQCPGAWNLCFGGPVPLLGTLRAGDSLLEVCLRINPLKSPRDS